MVQGSVQGGGVRVETIGLKEAEKILAERKQNYARQKDETIIKVHALKDEAGNVRGIAIWGRVSADTARRVHIYTDGSPMGWTMLYGNGCRALGSDGFTTIKL